tara:strand:+ start:1230 stop:1418 length:189 start_codon:yes stop_codon:yes gene_type:complete
LDKTLTTPEMMQIKAREIQLDQREANAVGTENFDAGQRGSASIEVNDMSPIEKISAGLSKQR